MINLETAVQDDEVMQDFELESLPLGVDHSQKVKATPSGSDYSSKDCVNFSSSTAVSRIKPTYKFLDSLPCLTNGLNRALWIGLFRLTYLALLQFSFINAAENDDEDEPLYISDKIPAMRSIFSYRAGKGLGYSSGYSSAGFFFTPISSSFDLIQPFVDLRYHCFNNGKGALNAGIGARYIHEPLDTVIGFNAFYDYRNEQQAFHQVGIGFEWLASLFDARINAYFPVGNQKYKSHRHLYTYPDNPFASSRTNKDALAGLDAELSTGIGKWVENEDFDIFIALGGYFYKNRGKYSGDHVIGGRFLFGAEINALLSIEVSTTYDSVFKSGIQGVLLLVLPFDFFAEQKFNSTVSFLKESSRERPIRNEILVTNPSYNVRD